MLIHILFCQDLTGDIHLLSLVIPLWLTPVLFQQNEMRQGFDLTNMFSPWDKSRMFHLHQYVYLFVSFEAWKSFHMGQILNNLKLREQKRKATVCKFQSDTVLHIWTQQTGEKDGWVKSWNQTRLIHVCFSSQSQSTFPHIIASRFLKVSLKPKRIMLGRKQAETRQLSLS